ncbi:ABC transporter permease/substrate-binding protein [Convivina praedatoris]|uniref:ABC transmembrane type-1 domain-containing protein n=1 Tax=Convivina praedatoris TaxID=2880963 RepID=A0ABM9D5K3_9LACO|nr:ABC transporter permease/substrate-binding protein [Convivina sp. LMG 32447]CAH1855847.1 hypothetical protein R077815_01290 [Convivina sp. LMG 32447]CAH1856662.1 hypothetical protein LMG032447_01340 [Convivina sp. LMG 32447]CAH1856823.1 hypothetical protein R078138_01443 [Convivina sp. LMG 32447]
MVALINYLNTNQADIMKALWQHISISFLAILITILIAIPLAIVLMSRPRWGELCLQIAGIVQTIPSLAILGLLIPIVGIGTTPAIIALVLYAIMPVFSNTYAGLTNIDPQLTEAAEAFGLSKTFKLFRIQLPLALPMILTGIRIAMVMIIGTATLAALVGGGGLGSFILLGIQTNNNEALLVGAVLSALLALLFSYLIKFVTKVSVKIVGISLAVVCTLGLFVGGYGLLSETHKETITIAGKMGGEPEILINMYQQVIEQDNPDVQVKIKPNFGDTFFLFNGLKSGKIDIYPEFTGTALQSLAKVEGSIPHDPKQAYQAAKTQLAQQFQLTYLAPMRYQNGYALTVRAGDAEQYHLKTTADLARQSGFKAAFDDDFYRQPDGYPGLARNYGLQFDSIRTMAPALRYQALNAKQVDVTDAYTTDPEIKEYNLKVLDDNENFFPPYQAAPLMKATFAKKHLQVVKSLNRLSNQVTTQEMQAMNYQVTVQKQKAATVAHEYLQRHHLIK